MRNLVALLLWLLVDAAKTMAAEWMRDFDPAESTRCIAKP